MKSLLLLISILSATACTTLSSSSVETSSKAETSQIKKVQDARLEAISTLKK